MPAHLTPLLGRRFDKLVVTARLADHVSSNGKKTPRWAALCDCGATTSATSSNLIRGYKKSCGCLTVTHGKSEDSAYKVWRAMIARCYNPGNSSFARYGARGITVCDAWRESFDAFLRDMGPRPSPAHQVDRFPDNNGNYEPGNCRWATPAEQARNRSTTRTLTVGGRSMCMEDWADAAGIAQSTVSTRVQNGWSDERAVLEPVSEQHSHARRVRGLSA